MLESFLIYIASLAAAAALTSVSAYAIAQSAAADPGDFIEGWERD